MGISQPVQMSKMPINLHVSNHRYHLAGPYAKFDLPNGIFLSVIYCCFTFPLLRLVTPLGVFASDSATLSPSVILVARVSEIQYSGSVLLRCKQL